MPNPVLAQKVENLKDDIVQNLNDAHIFLEQVGPLLTEAKATFTNSKSRRAYYVPSESKRKFALRTDKQLQEIYNNFSAAGLYEAFLVTAVSQFESFLADVLVAFLNQNPMRITETFQGIPACQTIAVRDLIAAPNKEVLIQKVLTDHVGGVFRQRPSLYMAYATKILSIKNDPSFATFYEVAATRDLVVHNNGIINDIYLHKAAQKARGALGTKLPVNKEYYYGALVTLKRVAVVINRDIAGNRG